MSEPTVCFTIWIPSYVDVAIKAAAIREQKSTNDLRVELIRAGLKVEQEKANYKREIMNDFETFFVGYDYGPIGSMYNEFYVIARSYPEMQFLVEENIKTTGYWDRVGWHNIQLRDGVKEIPAGSEVIWFEFEKL